MWIFVDLVNYYHSYFVDFVNKGKLLFKGIRQIFIVVRETALSMTCWVSCKSTVNAHCDAYCWKECCQRDGNYQLGLGVVQRVAQCRCRQHNAMTKCFENADGLVESASGDHLGRRHGILSSPCYLLRIAGATYSLLLLSCWLVVRLIVVSVTWIAHNNDLHERDIAPFYDKKRSMYALHVTILYVTVYLLTVTV